jgi:hypothetical protein
MERVLKKEKLLETAERLSQRIGERFPNSGLSRVAAEVVQVTKEALVRAERIRRPNLWLRAGLVLLGVIAVAGIAQYVLTQWEGPLTLNALFQFLDKTKGGAAYLAAVALFLVTLEFRLKRRRALQAIHELRAMAHIIDMHQLAKDPDLLGAPGGPLLASGRVMSADDMGHYLHYSTELLALVSKIGQLYVQGFADATVLAAVDQFENLATGLSSKIWQKIMILERIRSDVDTGGDGQPLAPGPATAAEAAPKVPEAPA